jgi:hypothetical protein
MNFIPALPFMQQQTYGMGMGDWQQYAGFGKSNPFGGNTTFDMSADKNPKKAAVPPSAEDTNPMKPVAPYEVKPIINIGQMGANPNGTYGAAPSNQFGATKEDLINQHYGD